MRLSGTGAEGKAVSKRVNNKRGKKGLGRSGTYKDRKRPLGIHRAKELQANRKRREAIRRSEAQS